MERVCLIAAKLRSIQTSFKTDVVRFKCKGASGKDYDAVRDFHCRRGDKLSYGETP